VDSCSPHLQMVPLVIALLRADECFFLQRACKAFLEAWDQAVRFELVASRLRAEPIGEVLIFLSVPEVEYTIERLER